MKESTRNQTDFKGKRQDLDKILEAIEHEDITIWNNYVKSAGRDFVANLDGANLCDTNLSEANLIKANLHRANLENTVFIKANLSEANLRKANLKNTYFLSSYLIEANLTRADLQEANLCSSRLNKAILRYTILNNATLIGAILIKANLRKASLKNCCLRGADLSESILYKADLTNTDFRLANLINAYLKNAVLTGIKLYETLRDQWNIEGVVCEYAYWDSASTKMKKYLPGEFEITYRYSAEDGFKYAVGILLRLSDEFDKTTGAHIKRVGEYCRLIAQKLGMDDEFCEKIREQAMLHDIGKICVNKDIVTKKGKLTKKEWEEMKKHTTFAAKILGDHPKYWLAKTIALYHHERWNGGGYPFGLKGSDIPIEARICSLADVYDSVRSRRPYKKSMTHKDAYTIITRGDKFNTPGNFDPEVLEAFKELHEEFDKIFNAI